MFPVYGPEKELVLSIERIAAPLFGILTYGIQMLAYQDNPAGLSVWVARRASWKRTFPGMLDSTVGGSLPTGESPFECLLREAEEEASFTPNLVKNNAIACGTINYMSITDERSKGEPGLLCPEVQFCYEMKIPPEVIPVPGDHESQEIILLNIEQLKTALANV
jgi:8-oxo-dGTP pyrophosphatase MutT (NUDIX family)